MNPSVPSAIAIIPLKTLDGTKQIAIGVCMEYVRLYMSSRQLLPPTQVVFPDGYSFRLFQPGDEFHWARIACEAEQFTSSDIACTYFHNEFMNHPERVMEGCFFCCDGNGMPVGSATAWFCSRDGEEHGMLRWVVVSKSEQGKGLCRPLAGLAVQALAKEYERAFLHTQTTSFKGIRVYLDMGFDPDMQAERAETGWEIVLNQIQHPRLAAFLLSYHTEKKRGSAGR